MASPWSPARICRGAPQPFPWAPACSAEGGSPCSTAGLIDLILVFQGWARLGSSLDCECVCVCVCCFAVNVQFCSPLPLERKAEKRHLFCCSFAFKRGSLQMFTAGEEWHFYNF